MARPSDMPPAEAFKHGTRARYSSGCRCRLCKAAKSRATVARDRDYKEAVVALGVTGNGPPLTEVRRGRGGVTTIRYSENTCPGVNGELCPRAAVLRKDSSGGLCRACGNALVKASVWNGLVDAELAREHLRKLSAQGVGYKQVADAACISKTVMFKILSGRRKQIKASTLKAILEVDHGAICDGSYVDAAPVWRMVRRLVKDHGYAKVAIARKIGQMKGQGLQIGKKQVRASTAFKIKRLLQDADGEFLKR